MRRNSLVRLKRVTTVLAVIAVGASVYLLLPQLKGKSESAAGQTVEGQVVSVARGDLTTDITGTGNLALSSTADLAFQLGGTVANPLYVQEVPVKDGDSVKQGQVLARADISGWQSQVSTLETSLTQAQTSLDSARLALDAALAQTEVSQLEIQLKQEAVRRAQIVYFDEAIKQQYGKGVEADFLAAAAALRAAETALSNVTSSPQQIESKKLAVQTAEAKVKDAANQLAQAQATSPELTAPFDGFVTRVSVKGGDEIKKGTVAVSVADPTKFQADILVGEMDILRVQIGARATVQPAATADARFPARVTYISPTASIQQGVVNYKTTVTLESVVPIRGTSAGSRSTGTASTSSPSTSSGQARQPAASGSGQTGTGGSARLPSTGSEQAPSATAAQTVQLRQGLSVNVSIVLEETKDVLMVPNRAVTRRERATFVKVVKDGAVEERWVLTGTSNLQYTEIIAGVEEGEKVLIPRTTTTTTTTQNQPRIGGFGIPMIR